MLKGKSNKKQKKKTHFFFSTNQFPQNFNLSSILLQDVLEITHILLVSSKEFREGVLEIKNQQQQQKSQSQYFSFASFPPLDSLFSETNNNNMEVDTAFQDTTKSNNNTAAAVATAAIEGVQMGMTGSFFNEPITSNPDEEDFDFDTKQPTNLLQNTMQLDLFDTEIFEKDHLDSIETRVMQELRETEFVGFSNSKFYSPRILTLATNPEPKNDNENNNEENNHDSDSSIEFGLDQYRNRHILDEYIFQKLILLDGGTPSATLLEFAQNDDSSSLAGQQLSLLFGKPSIDDEDDIFDLFLDSLSNFKSTFVFSLIRNFFEVASGNFSAVAIFSRLLDICMILARKCSLTYIKRFKPLFTKGIVKDLLICDTSLSIKEKTLDLLFLLFRCKMLAFKQKETTKKEEK